MLKNGVSLEVSTLLVFSSKLLLKCIHTKNSTGVQTHKALSSIYIHNINILWIKNEITTYVYPNFVTDFVLSNSLKINIRTY